MQKERRKKLVKKIPTKKTKASFALITSAVVLVCDQLSKMAARKFLANEASVPIIRGLFHLTLVKNLGAAFGIFQKSRLLLIIIAIFALIGLLAYNQTDSSMNRLERLSIGLLIGGALGNLLDRLIYGSVTDFLDFRIWPVFNISDVAISIGVTILIFNFLLNKE